jgi:predicted DNA binding CopG/RHH family protein
MKKKKIKLDAYERDIERNIGKGKKLKNEKQIRKQLIEAAKNYVAERDRKAKSVTIRLQESDIEAMRNKPISILSFIKMQ